MVDRKYTYDWLLNPSSTYDYLHDVLIGDEIVDGGLLFCEKDYSVQYDIENALTAVRDEFTWDNDFEEWEETSECVLVAFQKLSKELTNDRVRDAELKKLGKILLRKVQPLLDSISEKSSNVNWNYNIYCSYNEDNSGEYDGDPRYENVDLDDLEKVVTRILNDFLQGKLKGSTDWPPVEYDLHGSGITTAQYKRLNSDRKEDCMINTLRIECYPTKSSECEEEYVVEVNGDGTISRNDFKPGRDSEL